VFLDTEALVNGNGYQQTPWDNWSDAVDDAEALSLHKIEIASDATLDRNLSNFTVVGINLPTVDLAGFDCNNAIFNQVSLTGAQGTGNSPLLALTCNVIAVTDFNGSMLTVSVVSSISIADGAFCLINEVIPAVGGMPWTLDMGAGGAASTVQLQNISGGMTVTNMDNVDDEAHFAYSQGAITIDASCTDGSITVSGSVKITDNSGAGCTVNILAVDHELVMGHIMENGETFAEQTRLMRAEAAGTIVRTGDLHEVKSASGAKNRITANANEDGRLVTSTDGQ
jgi:hypothetical protein